METLTKTWIDGSCDTYEITPQSGAGDSPISVISTANSGIKRSHILNVNTADGKIHREVKVSQIGQREPFVSADGLVFIGDGGYVFGVIIN